MKRLTFLLVAIILLVASGNDLVAQDQSSPMAVVNLFKAYIDGGNVSGMLSIYGDVELNAPLLHSNYSRMTEPMQTLAVGWYGRPFSFEKEETQESGEVVVHLKSPNTEEYIKFYTANYEGSW